MCQFQIWYILQYRSLKVVLAKMISPVNVELNIAIQTKQDVNVLSHKGI